MPFLSFGDPALFYPGSAPELHNLTFKITRVYANSWTHIHANLIDIVTAISTEPLIQITRNVACRPFCETQ